METLNYHTSGISFTVPNSRIFMASNNWIVTSEDPNNHSSEIEAAQQEEEHLRKRKAKNFELFASPLDGTEGMWVRLPIGNNFDRVELTLDDDTLIVSILDTWVGLSKILVVHLDKNGRYDEYPGFGELVDILGVDGNILFLMHHVNERTQNNYHVITPLAHALFQDKQSALLDNGSITVISGWNLQTGHVEFQRDVKGTVFPRLYRIYNGSRTIVVQHICEDRSNDTYEIVSVPDMTVHLQIEGHVIDFLVHGHGVFYVSKADEKQYYADFAGKSYLVNFEESPKDTVRTPSVLTASFDAGIVWIKRRYGENWSYLVKYILESDFGPSICSYM